MAGLLSRPGFRAFWLANLVSNLGTSSFVLAITWLTVKQHGAAGIASLALAYGLPQMLLQLVGGTMSDRFDRRHLFALTQSGLLLMARNPHSQRQLSLAFETRQIHKHYVAVVHGQLQGGTQGLIDLPLAVDWPNRPLQKVDPLRGKPSQTRWQILEQAQDKTRLLLQPLSGRTHQLRVHLQAIGHPIVGDALYGADAGPQAPRLLLHASALMFTHPLSGQSLHIESPPPF